MTLDADVIRGRCGEIAQSVTRLRQLGTMDREAFLGNADAQDIACYRLLVAMRPRSRSASTSRHAACKPRPRTTRAAS